MGDSRGRNPATTVNPISHSPSMKERAGACAESHTRFLSDAKILFLVRQAEGWWAFPSQHTQKFIEIEKVKHSFHPISVSFQSLAKRKKITQEQYKRPKKDLMYICGVKSQMLSSPPRCNCSTIYSSGLFLLCVFFFSAIKKRLIEICLSLTWFLHIINLIGWLTDCFVYYSCFFA